MIRKSAKRFSDNDASGMIQQQFNDDQGQAEQRFNYSNSFSGATVMR